MSSLYQRRIEQEEHLVKLLAQANPDLLWVNQIETGPTGQSFRCTLGQTDALVEREDGSLCVYDTHIFTLYFRRFFPSVPIELSLSRPVFHPNVHPENGFACLWSQFSPRDTVIEAVTQLQRIITWCLMNAHTDHLLQPKALDWHKMPGRSIALPLGFRKLSKPYGFELARTYGERAPGWRKRLS
jgi:ubiquitin-protein ligase